jgi:NADH-quinone oxidoreductase subunit L
MPITFWTFLIAALAIAGFPPLAGFVSKDEILTFAWLSEKGSPMLWALGAIAALCTAFYMFRLVYLTFLGENRSGEAGQHAHESPFVMTVVLEILAVLSAIGGAIAVPHVLGGPLHFPNYLEGWLRNMPVVHLTHHGTGVIWLFMGVSFLIALAGLGIAHLFYKSSKTGIPERFSTRFGTVYRLALNKYFVDEIYEKLILNPLYQISRLFLFEIVDKRCIDATVNFFGRLCRMVSRQTLKLQQGDVQYYLLYMVLGLLVLSAVVFWAL